MKLPNPLSVLKFLVRPFLASASKLYSESYIGLEDIFYGRNHVVAFDIDEVRISLREPWNPSPEVAKHIEKSLSQKPPLYDGLSLRLLSFGFDRNKGVLSLEISRGKYSQYLFTNLDNEFRRRFPNPRFWFNALNIGALVVTRDNKLRLHRRSSSSIQSPGKLDTPCGHPTGMAESTAELIIKAALQAVLKKELGRQIEFDSYEPLTAFIAHPNLDFNLMYLVRLPLTSQEVSGKDIEFIPADTDSITAFLRKRRTELSRSLPETILHLIRKNRLKTRELQNSANP